MQTTRKISIHRGKDIVKVKAEMTQMLELANQSFKAVIIKVYQEVRENTLERNTNKQKIQRTKLKFQN